MLIIYVNLVPFLEQEENYLDRRSLKDKLNIHTADDESVLEGLVVSALQSREKRNDANDVQQSLQDRTDLVYPASVDVPAESKDDDLDSVPEEESVVEEEEEDDVAYSQIEDRDTVESRDQSRVSSAVSSPVKAVAAPKDDGDSPLQLDAKHLSPLNSSGAKSSPTPPALHPSFHGHDSKQLDVSSSFEADSPARSQASHVAQQKMNAVVLEDSFAEEPEEEEEDDEFSVEEEIEEEVEEREDREDSMAKEKDEREEKELTKAVSPAKSPDRDTKWDDSRSLSGKEEEGEEQGPEYDSDHSSHSAAEAKEMSQERAQIGHKVDSSKLSDSDSSVQSAGGKAAPSSLRPAVADDFDPTDRSAADHSLFSSSSNRNRVAVRRAAMEAAESKNSGDSNAPGAKANVFRLGQSSISRSQLGWGSETSAHAVDDDRSEDEDDDDEFAATEKGARNGGGTATATARYTSTSQMEAVSFDTDEDDGDRPSPVRAEPRRSNNQESESEGEHDRNESKVKDKDNNSSRESAHSAGFEAEDDSEGDVSFGDDEDVLPSVGKGVPARTAFGSPPTKSTSHAEKEDEDEGDDEYGDDDFVEDEEEEEENEPQQKPVPRQAPTTGGGLFSTRAGTIPNKSPPSNHDDEDEEENEEGSVEEEIEEEVEEDMSVGDMVRCHCLLPFYVI